MVTNAFERYLETIFEVESKRGKVRVKDIADSLEVSYPSVSEMIDKLAKAGMVTHDKYQDISLSTKGRRIGRGLYRKHAVIKDFLENILGVDEEVADYDACEIEHVISDETLGKLIGYLESLPPAGKGDTG